MNHAVPFPSETSWHALLWSVIMLVTFILLPAKGTQLRPLLFRYGLMLFEWTCMVVGVLMFLVGTVELLEGFSARISFLQGALLVVLAALFRWVRSRKLRDAAQ